MTDQKKLTWHKWIFLVVFIYTLLLGLFIQLVFLPHLVPSMHMADGVLAQNYDSYTFHTQARTLADLIKTEGWSHWEWRPGASGISSLMAVFYVFFGPHIWLMMPYNALVHAFSVVVLFDLFRSILPGMSRRACLIGALPYAFFPSTLLWTTQVHKDGLFFLAVFMLIWVSVRVMQYDHRSRNWLYVLWLFVVCVLGQFFLWWFRRDRITFFELFYGLCIFGMLLSWVARKRRMDLSTITSIGLLVIMIVSGALFLQWRIRPNIHGKGLTDEQWTERYEFSQDLEQWDAAHWEPTSWLPEKVDAKLALMTEIRNNYFLIHWKSNSAIDRYRVFKSADDMIRYIPRMLAISYFVPFPTDWLDAGSSGSATIMRRLVALETFFVYLSFAGLLCLLWKHWRNPYLWYLLLIVTVFMMVYAYVFPNVGTLYRQRFGFLSLVTGLGFLSIASWFDGRRRETVSLRIVREEPELAND